MAENDNTQANGPVSGKQVMLGRIYIKDCSYEAPRAGSYFSAPVVPEVKVNMRTGSQPAGNDEYEVTLTVTAEANAENRSVFVVEVQQAGLFTVRGFEQQELAAILGSYCPSILFPYVRAAISDLVMKGGMPTLLLQPMNFDAVYAQSLGAAATPGTAVTG